MAKTYTLSSNGISDYLYDVWYSIASTDGTGTADIIAYPLFHYINRGLAPTPFLKTLLATVDPSVVADICRKGGSVDSVIRRVKAMVRT